MTDDLIDPETKKPTLYFIIIGGVVFAIILLFLIFGFNHEKPSNKVNYGYFTFEEIGGLWQTNIKLGSNVYSAMFRFNPKQVEDVHIEGNFSGFHSSPIYITFDPEAQKDDFKYLALASTELSLNIVRALNFTVEGACTKNATAACTDRPIINCGDEGKSVIYITPNPPPQIVLKGSCVMLTGERMDLLKSVDRMLYQWYHIMSQNSTLNNP